MKLKPLLTLVVTVLSLNLPAQKIENSEKDLDNHEHHKNEIGIANSSVYFLKEKVFAYGLHIHYVRNIPNSSFYSEISFFSLHL